MSYLDHYEPPTDYAWERFEELQADGELPEYSDDEAGFEAWLRDEEEAGMERKYGL